MYQNYLIVVSLISFLMFVYFFWLFEPTRWYGFIIYKAIPMFLSISNLLIAMKLLGLWG